MKNLNLIEMVQEILESRETAYSLSKKSGISEQLIGKYRNGITTVAKTATACSLLFSLLQFSNDLDMTPPLSTEIVYL